MRKFNVILFDGFETLDAFGPVEVIGRLIDEYSLAYHSQDGGLIKSRQQVAVDTLSFAELDVSGIMLIPGGMGTRVLVNDMSFIEQLKELVVESPYVLTVCTGAALLAKTGMLNGMKATSNKRAFEWARSNGTEVEWIKRARWVKDGKYYTSSGISAGMDMALGFVGDLHGIEIAQAIAEDIEYLWNADADNDPFAAE